MGLTIAAGAAAPLTGGASFSVPAMVYAGQIYDEQDDNAKDPGRALLSGVASVALERLGIKGIGLDKVFTSSGRKEAVKALATKNKISDEAASKLLTKTLKEESNALSTGANNFLLNTFKTGGSTLGAAAKGAAAEGITEAAQELLAVWGEGHDLTGLQLENRLKNAAVTGGAIGGTLSGTGHLYSSIGEAGDVLPQASEGEKTALRNRDIQDFGKNITVEQGIVEAERQGGISGETLQEQAANEDRGRIGKTIGTGINSTWRGHARSVLSKYTGKWGSVLQGAMGVNDWRGGVGVEDAKLKYTADYTVVHSLILALWLLD